MTQHAPGSDGKTSDAPAHKRLWKDKPKKVGIPTRDGPAVNVLWTETSRHPETEVHRGR